MVAKNGNSNTSNRAIVSVRSLINNRKLTKPQRAFIGKRVKRGEFDLELTDKLIAQAVGCSVSYLHAAERCSDSDECKVKEGFRPLIWPKDVVNGNPVSLSLDPPPQISDLQLDDIVRLVGPERAWDAIQRTMS
jgi:hypothetical protein